MLRMMNVPPAVGTFGFVTFLVLLPVAALVFGILLLALLSAVF